MKEFMLLIRNEGDSKTTLSAEEHKRFLKACEVYIEELTRSKQLISAQPLVREGAIVSGSVGSFTETPFNGAIESMTGYYHILANDQDEAISIAKRNPEFAFIKGAKIEFRPVKMKEQLTDYTYPTHR